MHCRVLHRPCNCVRSTLRADTTGCTRTGGSTRCIKADVAQSGSTTASGVRKLAASGWRRRRCAYPAEHGSRLRPWSQVVDSLRQGLVESHHKRTARPQGVGDAPHHRAPQLGLEIGKHDVAAEDEIEAPRWRHASAAERRHPLPARVTRRPGSAARAAGPRESTRYTAPLPTRNPRSSRSGCAPAARAMLPACRAVRCSFRAA